MSILRNIISSKVNPFRQFSQKSGNLYSLLQLPQSCTTEEVRESFVNLAKRFDPDKNAFQNSSEKFHQLFRAYNILICPASRRLYDIRLNPKNTYKHPTDVLHRKYHDPYHNGSKYGENPEADYYISHWRDLHNKQQAEDLFKVLGPKLRFPVLKKVTQTCNDIGVGLIFCMFAQIVGAGYLYSTNKFTW